MIVHLRIILLLQGYQRESNHAVLPYFDSVSGMSELHTCIQSPLRLLPLKQVLVQHSAFVSSLPRIVL